MEASFVTRTGPPPGATFSAFERFFRENYATVVRIAHGVTGDEAKLVYLGQAGALNESISDVFGSLV